jgi:hypothetical protein
MTLQPMAAKAGQTCPECKRPLLDGDLIYWWPSALTYICRICADDRSYPDPYVANGKAAGR